MTMNSEQEQRERDAAALAKLNAQNRARYLVPPLPPRAPAADGRSAGGVVDERFGRK